MVCRRYGHRGPHRENQGSGIRNPNASAWPTPSISSIPRNGTTARLHEIAFEFLVEDLDFRQPLRRRCSIWPRSARITHGSGSLRLASSMSSLTTRCSIFPISASTTFKSSNLSSSRCRRVNASNWRSTSWPVPLRAKSAPPSLAGAGYPPGQCVAIRHTR